MFVAAPPLIPGFLRRNIGTTFFTAVVKRRKELKLEILKGSRKIGVRRFRDWALVLLYYSMGIMRTRS